MTALPALYISHGSPMLALESAPSRRFMEGLGATLARPRAIVVASAHYEPPGVRVDASPRPRTIHDFGGFPEALYQMQYPAPGGPALAADIVARLAAAGIPAMADTAWGFDHGTWMPLRLIYPDAEIPVVAMSVDPVQPACGATDTPAIGFRARTMGHWLGGVPLRAPLCCVDAGIWPTIV